MRIINLIIAALLCIGLLSQRANAQAKSDANTTTSKMLGFHIPDKDFKPSEVPEWVYQSPVQAFDMQWGEGTTDIKKAAELGAKVAHNFGIKPYWPLKKDNPSSGVETTKSIEAKMRIDLAHSLGMRYCYGVYPWAPIPLLKQHPDWVIHPEDNDKIEQEIKTELGETISMDEYAKLGRLCVMCFNSPYADYYIDCLSEIVRDYKMDAISFDGNYHPPVCYCRYCKEKYLKATGKSVPSRVDINDLEYRRYLTWAGDQHEAFFQRMHKRLRKVNPEFAIMSWSVNSGRWPQFTVQPSMSRRMNMVIDCPFQEWWTDEWHRGSTIYPAFAAAYGWAVTGHRAAAAQPYFMTHRWPYGVDSFPEHEAIRQSLLVVANGSYCPIAFNYQYSESALKEVAKRAKWQVKAQPHKWAAVLVSEQTRVNYGRDKIAERYASYPLGVFRLAYEEHLPLNLITEWDLRPQELAQYAVVFLPNAACLSDDQVRVIRDYVANGGAIIASSDTSMFDEIGQPRPNFALTDVFGVKFCGRPGETTNTLEYNLAQKFDNAKYWNNLTGIAAISWADSPFEKDAEMKKLCPSPNANYKGPVTLVTEPADKSNLLMTIRESGWEPGGLKFGKSPIPGAVMNNFGKGKSIYLAAGIDAANYSYSYIYQRLLLRKIVDMVAAKPLPIVVEAPKCVQTTFYEQKDKDGRRILVHLFNDINTTSNHGDQEVEVPVREETIPISGIKIRFNGYNIKSFHLEPEGVGLWAKADGTTQTIEVPPLGMHSIVVGELGE